MGAAKKSLKVATDLAWGITHEQSTQKPHKIQEVVDMLSVMYPGINYWHTQIGTVATFIAKHDLLKAHPSLASCKTDTEAVEKLGDTIDVKKVRPCKGYEWQNWKLK